ncbi:MAG: ribonucleotide reductase N-terminal alpha domain-containing protein, partial [Nanoarchaeota archaeon]
MGEQKNINNLEYENSELIRMFEHKSKLSTIIKNNWISSYKNLLFMLREMQKSGEIPVHPEGNYLNNNELATNIYKKKYYLKDISGNLIEKHPEEVFARLSAFISAVETEEKQREWAIKFYEQLYNGYFLPG